MTMATTWHGTPEEAEALNKALMRNCACEFDENGSIRKTTCPAHAMLLNDQRAIDGLIMMRRAADALEAEEWMRIE